MRHNTVMQQGYCVTIEKLRSYLVMFEFVVQHSLNAFKTTTRSAKYCSIFFGLRSVLICKMVLRRISCHGRNHSQASCEYSLTIFLCCQHHSEYSLLGSKLSTNLLFVASKCHVTIQQRGSSRCSKWPNRMGSLQW